MFAEREAPFLPTNSPEECPNEAQSCSMGFSTHELIRPPIETRFGGLKEDCCLKLLSSNEGGADLPETP